MRSSASTIRPRIVTLGGECAVSVAPFSELAHRYGDDLAMVWIDSHPDIGTPASHCPGFHAMAVAALTGHGDPQVQELLPAIVSSDRVALVGVHAWAEDEIAIVADWASAPSARTTCGRRPSRWETGWLGPAAHGSRSISTSTPSTATSWCSGSVRSRTG